ncbi:MAG: hypothetical protein AAGI52_14560 [Bacteroidota bacterium]
MRRLFLLFAFFLAACDADSGDGVTVYTVELQPLNGSSADGTAAIRVDGAGGVFSVDLEVTGLDDRSHPQFLFARVTEISECPTAADDTNADGFVDVVEGLPRYGGILLPLDNDLSSQEQNIARYPTGASYSYSTSARLSDVRGALERPDPDPDDSVVTLGEGGRISPTDYVVVVHGTSRPLPASVATLPGLDGQTTLPVACGTVRV